MTDKQRTTFVTLSVSEELVERLDAIALHYGKEDETAEDAIEWGLQMLLAAADARDQGMTVGAFGKRADGVRVEREILNPVTQMRPRGWC